MTAPRISERPERPKRDLIINLLNEETPWCYQVAETEAFIDHQAAEIVRLESDLLHYKSQFEDGVSIICRLNERRTELEAGREAFAREVCLMFSEHWNSGYDELPMIDRAIAAVKAREGK